MPNKKKVFLAFAAVFLLSLACTHPPAARLATVSDGLYIGGAVSSHWWTEPGIFEEEDETKSAQGYAAWAVLGGGDSVTTGKDFRILYYYFPADDVIAQWISVETRSELRSRNHSTMFSSGLELGAYIEKNYSDYSDSWSTSHYWLFGLTLYFSGNEYNDAAPSPVVFYSRLHTYALVDKDFSEFVGLTDIDIITGARVGNELVRVYVEGQLSMWDVWGVAVGFEANIFWN